MPCLYKFRGRHKSRHYVNLQVPKHPEFRHSPKILDSRSTVYYALISCTAHFTQTTHEDHLRFLFYIYLF